MEHNILDAEEKIKEPIRFKSFLALIIGLLISGYSLLNNGLFLDVLLFFLICVICLILAVFKNRLWNLVFVVSIIISYFKVIQIASFGFGVQIGIITIDMMPTSLLLIHIVIHFYEYLQNGLIENNGEWSFSSFIKSQNISKQENFSNNSNLKNRFIEKYKNKNAEELKAIVDNPDMVSEAKLAANYWLSKLD